MGLEYGPCVGNTLYINASDDIKRLSSATGKSLQNVTPHSRSRIRTVCIYISGYKFYKYALIVLRLQRVYVT